MNSKIMNSGRRLSASVERGADFTITVDGAPITAYAGESVAAAMTAAEVTSFRRDKGGAPRAPYCNMGVCFDCLVYVQQDGGWRRLRACMTPAAPGMTIARERPE